MERQCGVVTDTRVLLYQTSNNVIVSLLVGCAVYTRVLDY